MSVSARTLLGLFECGLVLGDEFGLGVPPQESSVAPQASLCPEGSVPNVQL